MTNSCELCAPSPFPVLFADTRLSVVLVTDTPDYPAFCRVIWRGHVREMTDLSAADRAYLMDWVFRTEAALRTVLEPELQMGLSTTWPSTAKKALLSSVELPLSAMISILPLRQT